MEAEFLADVIVQHDLFGDDLIFIGNFGIFSRIGNIQTGQWYNPHQEEGLRSCRNLMRLLILHHDLDCKGLVLKKAIERFVNPCSSEIA